MKRTYKNVAVRLDLDVHRQCKSLAALHDKTLLSWIREALAAQVAQEQGREHAAVAVAQ